MLRQCPVGHNASCHCKKHITCYRLCGDIEAKPLVNLRHVVRTRHYVKQEPTRDLISAIPTRASQIPQQNMAIKVRNLADQPEAETDLHLQITDGSVMWVVHIVSNVGSETPVVGTISENIRERRGCVTETVYEECFHDTFEVVEAPVVHSVRLDGVNDSLALVAEIFVYGQVVEDGVYDQRAEILEEEKCAVINLHAQILEHHSQSVRVFIGIFGEVFLWVEDNWSPLGSRLQGEGETLARQIILLVCII